MKYFSKLWILIGFLERVRRKGFFITLNELRLYYLKYSKFPKKLGPFRISIKYKIKCFLYYFKYIYYLFDYPFDFILNCPPHCINEYYTHKWGHNPAAFALYDKRIAYNICAQHNINYPKVFLVKDHGRIYEYGFIEGKEVIIKPIFGSQGDNVKKMTISKENLILFENCIFQEVIYPHKDLIVLAGSRTLHTIRIHGYVDMFFNVKIIAAYLRLSLNDVTDNMGKGSIGIPIILETGRLQSFGTREFPRLERLEQHPITGIVFSELLLMR